MKVVLDTNVIVSSLLLPDSIPGRILDRWREGYFQLIGSWPLFDELARALTYPKIARRTRMSADEVLEFVGRLGALSTMVDIEGVHVAVPGDPSDVKILATLVSGQGDWLVTGDRAILALAGRYPIVTPSAFLRTLRSL